MTGSEIQGFPRMQCSCRWGYPGAIVTPAQVSYLRLQGLFGQWQ